MNNRKQRRKSKPVKTIQNTVEWKRGVDDGVACATAIFLMGLLDAGRIKKSDVKDVFTEIMYKCDSVIRGYVNVSDLITTLREEYDVNVKEVQIR